MLCRTPFNLSRIWQGYPMITVHLIFLIMMTGCYSEEYFTKTQLERADIYNEGDQFTMLSNDGDTLTFTITERRLEQKKRKKCAECFAPTKYEVLIFEIDISGDDSDNEFSVSSDIANKYNYKFKAINTHFGGAFDLSLPKKSIVINGSTYNNSNCRPGTCYSFEKGFLRFNNHGDTLVLLP